MRQSGFMLAVCCLAWSLNGDSSQLFAMQRKSMRVPGGGAPMVEGVAVEASPAATNGAPGKGPAADGQPMPNAGATPAGGSPAAESAIKPRTRESKPTQPPNPAELKVRPDANGKVRFNFQGQPWLDVLEWLAQISNLSLDWQEIPGDHLNLATQRSYTVVEARDLINRHLLDRGYTMLRNGEVLTVANIKKLDPGMVPRVRPEDLKGREPHEFVKVSFALDWMIAEQAVEELKPMLSQNGKLTALRTTNRVEAMDSVTNLREIFEVLNDEQSRDGQEQLVKEFTLKHVRAIDADAMLRDLLGLQKAAGGGSGGGGGGGGDGHMQQQMFQMQQQMMNQLQQIQGGGGGGGGRPGGPGAEKKVYLVVNTRRNSILAQAPADKMAVITQAVKTLDVDSAEGGSLLQALTNTKIYRLAAIDPEPFVKVLGELGNLDPLTQIKVDKENQAIIVSGPLADHYVITELLKKLDGSDRRFEVIRLRRLEAEYVAGTIEFMMGAGDKKKDEQNPYMGWRYGFEIGGNQKKETKKFRVSADTENNRLLLWVNDIELKEIHYLLEKLGEIPSKEGNPNTLRVFELGSPEEAEKLLEKLRVLQPGLTPTDHPVREKRPPAVNSSTTEPEARGSSPAAKLPQPRADTTRRPGQSGRILQAGKPVPQVTFARLQEPPVKDQNKAAPPPASREPESVESQIFKRRLRRAIEEFQTIMPTFAPEDSGEASSEERSPPAETDAEAPGQEAPIQETVPPRTNRRQATDPVQATVTRDGQLVISSADTQALDALEEAIGRMSPPRRDFKIFHIKNRSTWVYGVVLNLEEYFGKDDKKKPERSSYDYYYGYSPPRSNDTAARTLSKRRIPKFISDSDSRTILVTGADPEQLRIIQELIDVYDRPEEGLAKALRLNRVFQLKYSRARVIADAVKEVYRDLLSENDPALQQQQNGKDKKPTSSERSYTYIYGSEPDDKGKEPEAPIKFKGLLSLGVDEISNTIVVSSQEGLLENVGQLITALDEAARPTQSTIQVLRVDRSIEASGLQARLAKILTRPQPQPNQQGRGNPNQQQPGQPPQNQGNNQQGEAVQAE